VRSGWVDLVAGVTLDTGALIAIERGDRRLQAIIDEAAIAGAEIAVPAGVVAQAWRGSARQARLSRFLALDAVICVPLDEPEARAAGALCGRAGTADIVDAPSRSARGRAATLQSPGTRRTSRRSTHG